MTAHHGAGTAPPRLDRSLISALIGNFLIRLDGGMVGMLLTFYLADINQRGIVIVTATTLGLLSSGYYIIELLFSPIMGAKSDEHGSRTLLLVGPLVGVLAALVASVTLLPEMLGLSHIAILGISLLLIALGTTRLLQGFAAAASIPSILSYLSARTEGSLALRGRVMSIFEVTTAVGLLVGPIVGAQLWRVLGPWGFTITAFLFLLSAAFFWAVRDDRAAQPVQQMRTSENFLPRLARLLRRGDLLVFAPAWLAINAIVGLWGTHLIYQMRSGSLADSQFLTGRFDENFISVVLGGYGLIFCIGVVAWGFTLGRLRELTVMRLSLMGLFGLFLATFGINHTADEPVVRWLFVGAAAIGLAVQSGFAPAAVTYLARLAARSAQDRGLFMGIYSVVLGLGQFIGHVLGGPFADWGGVNGILLLTLLLGLVATATILRLAPQSEEEQPIPSEISLGMHMDGAGMGPPSLGSESR